MIQQNINVKIRKQLRRLTNTQPSEWYLTQVMRAIRMRPKKMQTVSEIASLVHGAPCDQKTAKVRSALYELCADNKISFMSKHFHFWDQSVARKKGTRQVFFSKNLTYRPRVLPDWLCDEDEDIGDLASLSSERLQDLIDEARDIQIKRGIDRRYACLSGGVREQLADVFKKIKITDPVYFAHSDESLSFLTYTAVPAMPIDIVVDVGDGAQRLNCHHLTIFGKAIVTATDNIFGKEPQ